MTMVTAPEAALPATPLSKYACKRFSTLQAVAALSGATLHRLNNGTFMLSRWGLTRELRTLDEVATLLHGMGCGRGAGG